MARLLYLCLASTALFACAQKTDEPADATPNEGSAQSEAAPETPELAGEALVETDSAPIGSANVVIGLQNNAPYFSQASEGFCQNGGCQGGIVLNSGDIDLSNFPPGDVTITVTFDSAASGAGYRFPSDAYQAVAIAVAAPGGPPPTPVFGSSNWPSDFDPPSVSGDGLTLTFVDEEEDQDVYEYSVGLNGPNGRVVMDPKIENGGSGGGNK